MDVGRRDSHDGRAERGEGFLCYQCGDLARDTATSVCRIGDDEAPGLCYRFENRVTVERHDGTEIDDLDRRLRPERLRGEQSLLTARADRDDCDVVARACDVCL